MALRSRGEGAVFIPERVRNSGSRPELPAPRHSGKNALERGRSGNAGAAEHSYEPPERRQSHRRQSREIAGAPTRARFLSSVAIPFLAAARASKRLDSLARAPRPDSLSDSPTRRFHFFPSEFDRRREERKRDHDHDDFVDVLVDVRDHLA